MIGKKKPHVVIIGSGFAGLWAMRRFFDQEVDVTVLDRNNYHTFLPLLYQVGAAEVEPEQIAYPIRSLIRKKGNIRFIRANVDHLNAQEQYLEVHGKRIEFDYCILAIGSASNFFGVPGARERAFSLKTLDEGIVIRNHILSCFERASYCDDPAKKQRLLTFVVVGAGATGIEFSGALQELVNGPLKKDYPRISISDMRVILVESLDRVLSMFPKTLSSYTSSKLNRLGVEVRLGAMVDEIRKHGVHLKDGQVVPTETVIWTAGIKGPEVVSRWGLPLTGAGQVPVRSTLQVPGFDRIFVAGDLAYLEQEGMPLPQLAPVAVQQGRSAADNILLHIQGRELQGFVYRDRGAMVTIGRNAAVARVGQRSFRGFVAWSMWLVIHIMNLIGFRNRVFVLINWAWDYFFFERAVRLIMPSCCDSPDATSCLKRDSKSQFQKPGQDNPD